MLLPCVVEPDVVDGYVGADGLVSIRSFPVVVVVRG
jgi:hypothetical protein